MGFQIGSPNRTTEAEVTAEAEPASAEEAPAPEAALAETPTETPA